MMESQIKIFDSPDLVAQNFALDFANWVNQTKQNFHVALSGGSTPKLLFKHWASDQCPETDWRKVHFYWGDERCVPPDDNDSNFGVTNELFFKPVGIDPSNIHRIRGEKDPTDEAICYSELIASQVHSDGSKPVFDLVMLGMGSDGHTASIFPDQMSLMDDERICAVATHPESGQKRVTITGPVISNAARIAFLITGESKTEKYRAIADRSTESTSWPATRFFRSKSAIIYMDKAAAGK